MRYLSAREVMSLHQRLLASSGGAQGVRDRSIVEAAVAQPRMTFDGQELYSSIHAKAAALGHALVCGHGFVDGNKRVGHASMAVLLLLNGWRLRATVDVQESLVLQIARGEIARDTLSEWLVMHTEPLSP